MAGARESRNVSPIAEVSAPSLRRKQRFPSRNAADPLTKAFDTRISGVDAKRGEQRFTTTLVSQVYA